MAAIWTCTLETEQVEYPPEIQKKLEGCYALGTDKCTFACNGQDYEVEFKAWTQTNIRTGYKRHIERHIPCQKVLWYAVDGNTGERREFSTEVCQQLNAQYDAAKIGAPHRTIAWDHQLGQLNVDVTRMCMYKDLADGKQEIKQIVRVEA